MKPLFQNLTHCGITDAEGLGPFASRQYNFLLRNRKDSSFDTKYLQHFFGENMTKI